MSYPADWPRCPKCGEPALDGHITCGKFECDEHGTRRARDAARMAAQPLPIHAAFECRCPDKDCTGWRQHARLGGGHITRDEAMALLRQVREEREPDALVARINAA